MPCLLSLNNYFYRRGGAEAVFLEHNRLFEQASWEVVPFAMHHQLNNQSQWSDHFVDEIEFGQNYSLPRKLLSAFKITHSFEAYSKISRLADLVKPDIAHAHNVYHHISPSVFAALKGKGIPTVLTLHDLKIACPAYKMLTHDGICERCKGGNLFNVVKNRCIKDSLPLSLAIFLESRVQRLLGSYSKYVDRFVVPSRFYLEKLVEWGWDRDRFSYIPNFVDVNLHHYNGDVGRSFVYFGRLGPEKGLETLLRAAAQASAGLTIIGTGPEELKLKELACSLGTDVKFLGHQTGESLHRAIQSARAVVLPSEWYENAPMSIMESYALGRPVIGANIGGIPELVRQGETGVVFASGSVDSLAGTLTDFMEMSDSRISGMGRRGREWVEDEFTDTRYLDRMRGLYHTMGVSS